MTTILKWGRHKPSRQIVRQMMRLGHCLFLVTILAGCSLGGKPSYLVKQYVIEYPSPLAEGLAQGNELLKVERFSVAREYDTPAMIYRDGPFQRGVDPYNRWRVNPGDMVTDHLLRDLRKVGLFKAVFSYSDNEVTRYLLEGQVIEFLESREREGLKAVLGLNVTLLDLTKREISERIVFQRNYRSSELLETATYEGLAQAMSNAMEKISGQLMTDISKAIREPKK